MAPPDKDPLSKALTVDLSFKTVNIEFDIAKIGVEGLKADFSLKGQLKNYPPSHTENFTVKVYTFFCTAQDLTYLYKVGEEALSILFTIKQAPDIDVIPKFTVFAVKKIDGSNQVMSPAFVTLSSSFFVG